MVEQSKVLKTTKHAAIAVSHTFIPIAFETLGAWGKQALQIVTQLSRRITMLRGDKRETEFLRQRLSVAIRGNAIACLRTFGERQS